MITYNLLESIKLKTVYGELPSEITDIHVDSRKVTEGTMFVCTRGYTVDGHDFAAMAVEKGATLIVAEKQLDIDLSKAALVVVKDTFKALAQLSNKYYDYPSQKLTVFGVTGTNGKTTVSNLIHSILKRAGQSSALSGTIGFNLNGELLPSENTTCDNLTNQQMMQSALDRKIENFTLEVSSHGLALGRLWGIDFDVVAFTNLSHDHLDYHGTMEHYGYAKGLLFSQLGQDLQDPKYVILNADDEWYHRYSYMTPHEVISYGLDAHADFKAVDIEYFNDMTRFTLNSPQGSFEVEMKLLGKFNVYNVLTAMACLYARGMEITRLVEIIRDLPPVNGRMEKVDIKAPLSVYIDYAHTPDAIENAIQSVLPFKENKIIFLVGTGGNRDKTKRPTMAEKASLADYVILTTDDPRYEEYDSILNDLEKGMQHEHYALIGDRAEAVKHAIEVSEPGDIIIFAGKGHEDYQIIENTKYPHSDKEIAAEESNLKYGISE
ncbi:UDP-N-acetylmuramoyl-L-alanyl-D-glutamate--2,6-diaminopimelate ligase [Rossellomorea vietnamensis]|uniref:UDP-N-acetylmuramoyl-L-alanyl-D-glutamate--2, 6-diaminopimelate ligase n=1 Tax=Rossellomorea vietnamensis TaxID=218284 RepID=UPI001E30C03D|nr:UDP-N-acetylmuramoyl-L-alanyl-D-glutamate--2,6-diaminopimelate ligase [Rossellomorea vietnamensis]MCC5804595.1 UDP-N-acetylmuramoyl-L-alanyl-D-glutamate--2,6-diaminopimelate ligase [Rossellomorea vietnamensis]